MSSNARIRADLPTVSQTLVVALEHVPRAVFVLSRCGGLVHANALGRHRVETEGLTLLHRLARSIHVEQRDLEAHEMSDVGHPGLVMMMATPVDPIAGLAALAGQRWGLTARQRDVLTCVLRGHSNLRVSLELGISERTVEVHVTALFERARCCSRAELISSALVAV